SFRLHLVCRIRLSNSIMKWRQGCNIQNTGQIGAVRVPGSAALIEDSRCLHSSSQARIYGDVTENGASVGPRCRSPKKLAQHLLAPDVLAWTTLPRGMRIMGAARLDRTWQFRPRCLRRLGHLWPVFRKWHRQWVARS